MSDTLSTLLANGACKYADFEKAYSKDPEAELAVTQDSEGLKVNGKMAFLDGEKVCIREKKPGRWHRIIYNVRKSLGYLKKYQSFDDYWHQKQCGLSRKLNERLVSRIDTELLKKTSLAPRTTPQKGCVNFDVPRKLFVQCEKEGQYLTASKGGIHLLGFQEAGGMQEHLMDKADKALSHLSISCEIEQEFKNQLLKNIQSGIEGFINKKYSWQEMIEVIQDQSAEFIENNRYDEKTTRELEQVSTMALSVMTHEASQVFFLSGRANDCFVNLPLHDSADGEPVFSAGSDVNVHSESNVAIAKIKDAASQESKGVPVVNYRKAGASILSLNGMFYRPDVSLEKQIDIKKTPGSPVRLFKSRAEVDQYLKKRHADYIRQWKFMDQADPGADKKGITPEYNSESAYEKVMEWILGSETLAYIDIGCPAGTSVPMAGFTGNDNIVLLKPLESGERITISMNPVTPTGDKNTTKKKTLCKAEKYYEMKSPEVYRDYGKTWVVVFKTQDQAKDYVQKITYQKASKIAELNRHLQQLCADKKRKNAFKDRINHLTKELDKARREAQSGNIERNVAWEVGNENALQFFQETDVSELTFSSASDSEESLLREMDEDAFEDTLAVTRERKRLLEKRLSSLSAALSKKIKKDSELLSKNVHVNQLVLLLNRHYVDINIAKLEELAILCLMEGVLDLRDIRNADIPVEKCLTIMGVSPEKAETLNEKNINRIYLDLVQMQVNGLLKNEKFLNEFAEQYPVAKDRKKQARLLFKIQQKLDNPDVLRTELAEASGDGVKKVICSHYVNGTLRGREVFSAGLTTGDILDNLGIDRNAPQEKIYLELALLRVNGLIANQKIFNELTEKYTVTETIRKQARLLFKIQQKHDDPDVLGTQLANAPGDGAKKVLCSHYLYGTIKSGEVFDAGLTTGDVLESLGIGKDDSPEEQFYKLYTSYEAGNVDEKRLYTLCGSISGARKLLKQLEIVRLLELSEDQEITRMFNDGAKLKRFLESRMERCFGSPPPKTDVEAFNRFYLAVFHPDNKTSFYSTENLAYFEEDYGKGACIKVLDKISDTQRFAKLQKLEEIYTPERIFSELFEGKLNKDRQIHKMLIEAFVDDKLSLVELLELGLEKSEIIDSLSVVEINKLLARNKLDADMLAEMKIGEDELESSNARIQLLQEKASQKKYKKWEDERVLSDAFVRKQLLSLCTRGKVMPVEINLAGIPYAEILSHFDADGQVALCLKGYVPPEEVSEALECVEWNQVIEQLNQDDPEEERFETLLTLLNTEAEKPDLEKTIIPQRLPLVIKNAPALLMKKFGLGDHFDEDDEVLKEAAKRLYVAEVLPDSAMHVLGFYEVDLVKAREDIEVPVYMSELPKGIQEELGIADLRKFIDDREETFSDVPTKSEASLSINVNSPASSKIRYMDVMESQGFKASHLSDKALKKNVGMLYVAGVLDEQTLKAKGFNDDELTLFSGAHSLPVSFKKLDRNVQKDLFQWFTANNDKSETIGIAGNFKVSQAWIHFMEDQMNNPDVDVSDSEEDLAQEQYISQGSTITLDSEYPTTVNSPSDPDNDVEVDTVSVKNDETQSVSGDEVDAEPEHTDSDANEVNDNVSVNNDEPPPPPLDGFGLNEEPEENPAFDELMQMTRFNFLENGKFILKYYESILGTSEFNVIKVKMAEDILSGELRTALDNSEVVVDMGGWSKPLNINDMGPLKPYLE